MKIAVSIQDPDLNNSKLTGLTREMVADLGRRPGLEAESFEDSPQTGSKGDPVAVGKFILQLLGSGGAVTVLLNGFKAYFLRRQTLKVDIKRADGAKFSLHAENMSDHNLAVTATQLTRFLKG
ncbi:effector-associated constant component EACC1 [Tunturiibacter lichenicola]|uniref:effector-associated constant component EACC1 n=1 Tax=Tunturiibacter lichenicola TaxID=2051959 RepID=UPI003D9B3CFF